MVRDMMPAYFHRSIMSTSAAHNDCRKFHARFGNDALRFVSEPERRHRNLRGIYLRVVEEGEVAVGDVVEVVARAPASR
jgi:MOSC domain-containing protein YiiM